MRADRPTFEANGATTRLESYVQDPSSSSTSCPCQASAGTIPTVSVVHEDDVEWVELCKGEVFENRRRKLGAVAGSSQLGCSLTEVPPGKTAWPFHAHLGNEEAIYVLRGRATLRLGDEQHPLRAGDYVALRAEAKAAHQIINTGDEPFAYLAMSTMNPTDIVLYPDSNKHGLFAGGAPDAEVSSTAAEGAQRVVAFVPDEAAVDYWEGEPFGRTDEEIAAEEVAVAEEALETQVDEELAAMKERLGLD